MASYKGTYSTEQSLNFVIPIMVILFLGIIYVMTQRSGGGHVSFILIGASALTMFYWVRILKKMKADFGNHFEFLKYLYNNYIIK